MLLSGRCSSRHLQCLARAPRLTRIYAQSTTKRRPYLNPICRRYATVQSAQPNGLQKPTAVVPFTERQGLVEKELKLPSGELAVIPGTWTSLLDPLLPTHLRKDSSTDTTAFADGRSAASQIILQARQQSDIDVLAHLGLVEQRWEALQLVVGTILQKPRPPDFFRGHSRKTAAKWPMDQSLEEITNSSKAPTSFYSPEEDGAEAMADPGRSLEDLTSEPYSVVTKAPIRQDRDALGQLWRTLGRLILETASPGCKSPGSIMPTVLQIITQLNKQGYIPENTYADQSVTKPMALRQPPKLRELARKIMKSLMSIAPIQPEPEPVAERPNLRPEFWLEFILWCCVHGGWLKEGADIVTDMAKKTGPEKWDLISWHTGPKAENKARSTSTRQSTWNEFKAQLLFIEQDIEALVKQTGFKSDTNKPERMISSDVVAATVDGLLSNITTHSTGQSSVSELCNQTFHLKSFLGKKNMNLGVSNWDEMVARLVEVPNMHIEDDPKTMESILELAEDFGRETNRANAASDFGTGRDTRSYVFDGTAIPVGICHRILLAYVKARDLNNALRVLTKLQRWTTEHRKMAQPRHEKEAPSQSARGQAPEIDSELKTSEGDAFFPIVPPAILAALLDMITEAGAVEVGRWMIYAQDDEGPLIPPHLYNDQHLAPALIRFAAEAKDSSLLDNLKGVQSSRISGETLLALCEYHLTNQHWQNAVDVLWMMHEHAFHHFGEGDFTRLVRPIVRQIKVLDGSVSPEVTELLQALFQGRLGQVWGDHASTLDSVVGVLSTMHPALANVCAPFLDLGHQSKISISASSFDMLLEGAVKAFGSDTGQKLWELWCRSDKTSRKVREPDYSTVVNVPVSQKAERFSAGQDQPPPSKSPPLAPTITGYVVPTISTLRIIVQQALAEMHEPAIGNNDQLGTKEPTLENAPTVQQESIQELLASEKQHQEDKLAQPTETALAEAGAGDTSRHDAARKVLAWSRNVFMQDFHHSRVDVDKEYQGFMGFPDEVDATADPLDDAVHGQEPVEGRTTF